MAPHDAERQLRSGVIRFVRQDRRWLRLFAVTERRTGNHECGKGRLSKGGQEQGFELELEKLSRANGTGRGILLKAYVSRGVFGQALISVRERLPTGKLPTADFYLYCSSYWLIGSACSFEIRKMFAHADVY